ncbi:hypothetical protein [Ralstonia pseudosolanacearum]|uniref:hypothetical protein n=1 Tax=Ralstonia pseudosolanacearum TaxID=1310165 RepID=UPI002676B44E|nr:hypothetical protein [Ralstonia pseudosolanacearum]MDO3527961.1 hypothetical protein [Ralstonia pseudosolanacearum]
MSATGLRDPLLAVQFALRRGFGWTGLAGAVLLAVAAAARLATPALESGTRELHHQAQLARADSDAQLLETLPERFPLFAQSSDDVATILAQARAVNLTLGSAQYQIGADRSGAYTTYQVLLPVKDRYVAIRRFVALVLNSLPNAALQEIHVERPAVSGDVLDARIRFDLIYRASRS